MRGNYIENPMDPITYSLLNQRTFLAVLLKRKQISESVAEMINNKLGECIEILREFKENLHKEMKEEIKRRKLKDMRSQA